MRWTIGSCTSAGRFWRMPVTAFLTSLVAFSRFTPSWNPTEVVETLSLTVEVMCLT